MEQRGSQRENIRSLPNIFPILHRDRKQISIQVNQLETVHLPSLMRISILEFRRLQSRCRNLLFLYSPRFSQRCKTDAVRT